MKKTQNFLKKRRYTLVRLKEEIGYSGTYLSRLFCGHIRVDVKMIKALKNLVLRVRTDDEEEIKEVLAEIEAELEKYKK